MESISLELATPASVNELEPIFNLYREFYGFEGSKDGVLNFLEERLTKKQSVLFFARKDNKIVGFVQLYPSYSSVALKKSYILNDLFVLDAERKQGIATLLINKAKEFAKGEGCIRLSLSTAKDNPAQQLYEYLGFKESVFKFYNYTL